MRNPALGYKAEVFSVFHTEEPMYNNRASNEVGISSFFLTLLLKEILLLSSLCQKKYQLINN